MAEAMRRQGEDAREVDWLMGEEGRVYRAVYEEEWGRMVAEAYGRLGWRKKERDMWEAMSLQYEGQRSVHPHLPTSGPLHPASSLTSSVRLLCSTTAGRSRAVAFAWSISRRSLSRQCICVGCVVVRTQADWHYVTRWLSGQVTRLDGPSSIDSPDAPEEDALSEDERIAHIRAIIDRLKADSTNSGGRQRNPHLASVHLAYLLLLRSLTHMPSPPDSAYSELSSELLTYFRGYGSKPCFFHDVQAYLIALPPALRLALLETMREVSGPDYERGQTVGDGAARIPLLTSWHQCARFVNAFGDMSVDAMEALCLTYYHHFLLSSALSATPLSTSRGSGDPFLVLVSSALHALYERTGLSSYLFTLSVLLEHALSFSPHNFDHSLHLLRLYSHPAIGCPARSASIYQALAIKQIQHESLHHLVLHDLLRYGLLSSAYAQALAVLSVHSTYEKDEGSVLQLAYEQRRWGKVLELKEVRDRLERSWGRRWAREERQWMELVRAPSKEAGVLLAVIDKHREAAVISDMKDAEVRVNSDYSVLPCYESPSSRLHAQLNRPAPSLLPSFQPLRAPTPILPDSTYAIDEEYATYLQYKRLVPDLLSSAIRGDAAALRSHLLSLKAVLTQMEVAPFPSFAGNNGVSEPTAPPRTFDGLHWWLSFLCLETCACVLECREPTAALMSAPAPLTSAQLDDHALRWSSVQRQLHVLIDMVAALTPFISAAALQQPSDEKHAVVIGRPVARPFDASLLRHCSLFLHHASLYLVVSLQLLTAHIPNRKSAHRKKKKAQPIPAAPSSPAPTNTPLPDDADEERSLWEPLASTRLSLVALTKATRATLDGVAAVLRRLGEVEVEWSPAFGMLQRCAEVAEEVRGGGVREVGDVDTFVSQGIAACITSWTANGEELTKMVAGYTSALQHLKLQ